MRTTGCPARNYSNFDAAHHAGLKSTLHRSLSLPMTQAFTMAAIGGRRPAGMVKVPDCQPDIPAADPCRAATGVASRQQLPNRTRALRMSEER